MTSIAGSELDQVELVALAQQLVRIPSPQTELMEAEPAVQQFIAVCAEILADRGLEGRRDRMGNLLIEIGPSSADRALIIMAYAMNHRPRRWPTPGLVEGRSSGDPRRGSRVKNSLRCDDQARRMGSWRGGCFALSSASETDRRCRSLHPQQLGYTPPSALLLGTNNRVTLGNKGRLDVEIILYGQAI
jgi:hypothetical protein